MIVLKKARELKVHGYVETDGYSPRLISISDCREVAYIISNNGKQVLEECNIEYLSKDDCDYLKEYHDYIKDDELTPCILASHDEIIPLCEVMKI